MIITSPLSVNSVSHEYTVPDLSIIGEVDGLENVAYQAQIYLHSSVTFEHTYETVVYDENSMEGTSTTVTEEKTLTEFVAFSVDLNTSNIDPASFTNFDDLEEDQVVQWCLEADTDRIQSIQNEQESKVLESMDKLLNPRKYYRDTPVTPWRRRADEQSINNQ
jgi:hypothetical protein